MQTILIIDDDPALAELLGEYLGARGHRNHPGTQRRHHVHQQENKGQHHEQVAIGRPLGPAGLLLCAYFVVIEAHGFPPISLPGCRCLRLEV